MNIVIFEHYHFPVIKFRLDIIGKLCQKNIVSLFMYYTSLTELDEIKKIPCLLIKSSVSPISKSFLSFFRAQFEALVYVHKSKADLIIVYGFKQAIFRFFVSFMKVKSACFVAGFGRSLDSAFFSFYIRALRFYDVVFCLNSRDQDLLVNFGCRRVVLLPSEGVDVGKYYLNSYVPRIFEFCYVGRILRSKGVGRIIENFSSYSSGITIDMYGPLDEDVSSKDYVSERELLLPAICYRGEIQSSESVLREYKFLIFPSQYGEGLPLILIEAILAKCIPIVVENSALNDFYAEYDLDVMPNSWMLEDLKRISLKYSSLNLIDLSQKLDAKAKKVAITHEKSNINAKIIAELGVM